MVPSLTANCNSTLSNHTVGSLRSALATVDWIFCWNNSAKALTSIKVEKQEASKQFKEGGKTHEPKSTTTTTTTKQSDVATTQMIFLPLVSRASGGGPRGSVVLLELKNGQLKVSK